ncbi:MAG: hypothetical protein JEZ04_10845 [Spirochaetales bacterium]|nr:hypothetical protein [Spirochaetales bacterium]
MKKLPLIILFFTVLFFSAGVLIADDSQPLDDNETVVEDEADNLDDLFTAPKEDIVVEETKKDHREAFEKTETVKIKGKYTVVGGVGAGWTSWEFFPDLTNTFDPSIGLSTTASVSFDARPIPEFRVYGNFYSAFNPFDSSSITVETTSSATTMVSNWGAIEISELFCDYILSDFLYARMGKHYITWGQGRIFNPGNLMLDSGNNYNARVSFPSLAGFTFMVLTNGTTNYAQMVYGGKADFVIGDLLLSPALRYQLSEGLTGLLSLKQVLLKTDFFADVTAKYYDEFLSANVLAGFFREWEDIKLYGEYKYSWTLAGESRHDAGLVFGFKKPFGAPFDFAVQALHYFSSDLMSNSGSVTFGISQKIWPLVTMQIGLPIVYGGDSSYAVINNADTSGRRIALILSLKLSGTF